MWFLQTRPWNPPGLCSWTLRHRLYSVSNLTCINIDSHRCPKQFSKIVLISQSIYSTSVSARSVDIYNWGIRSDLENSIIPWLCKLLGLNRVRSKYQGFPYRGDGGVLLLAENGSPPNKPKNLVIPEPEEIAPTKFSFPLIKSLFSPSK